MKADRELLEAARIGFISKRAKIDQTIAEIDAELSGKVVVPQASEPAPKAGKRTMSAAARARISAAQKKRWAAHAQGKAAKPVSIKTAKRKMTKAGRAAIAEATRKRWAAYRKAQAGAAKTLAAAG